MTWIFLINWSELRTIFIEIKITFFVIHIIILEINSYNIKLINFLISSKKSFVTASSVNSWGWNCNFRKNLIWNFEERPTKSQTNGLVSRQLRFLLWWRKKCYPSEVAALIGNRYARLCYIWTVEPKVATNCNLAR